MTSGIGVIDRVLARVGKHVVGCVEQRGFLVARASSTVRAAPCPTCRCWSGRLHGSYFRQLAERPVLNERVLLSVETRRFKCLNKDCHRRTFAEDIHSLAGRHQRRTRSHAKALHALGHALGGEAATRLAAELGLSTSADTVLRELRRSAVTRRKHLPRIVGIDDWAIAKGHNYGTIVVDLERRQPIEVFAGREATAVADWMRANPSIRVIARDRAGAYSEAADSALPAATQVSDRWHLLCNLRDNVERMLQRMGPQLRRAAQRVTVGSVALGRQGMPRSAALRDWQRLSDERRAPGAWRCTRGLEQQRVELWRQIAHDLHDSIGVESQRLREHSGCPVRQRLHAKDSSRSWTGTSPPCGTSCRMSPA
ncbi:ISL3 family transposase [Variovorax rhizosphaerae]|uniref:ISL3 family transposase n=1 Tax=Variovorax rhizosphaerae TaxID=1836200 RepID=A0ABU8WY66_9BURK